MESLVSTDRGSTPRDCTFHFNGDADFDPARERRVASGHRSLSAEPAAPTQRRPPPRSRPAPRHLRDEGLVSPSSDRAGSSFRGRAAGLRLRAAAAPAEQALNKHRAARATTADAKVERVRRKVPAGSTRGAAGCAASAAGRAACASARAACTWPSPMTTPSGLISTIALRARRLKASEVVAAPWLATAAEISPPGP